MLWILSRQISYIPFTLRDQFAMSQVQIDGHNLNYHCHCFMWRICQILLTMLLSKKHQRLLEIVKISNYLYVTDEMIISNI